MKITKRELLCIVVLPVCAGIMSLRFGGNGNTFYAWLLGIAELAPPFQNISLWFSFLTWMYLVSLVTVVILEILHQYEKGKLFAWINAVSITMCIIIGFLEGYRNSICAGMVLLFLLSLSYWLLPSVQK